LAMTLSRDPAYEVRGAAAIALARLASAGARELTREAWQRVIQTLTDRGAVVPIWVMSGLSGLDARAVPEDLLSTVEHLGAAHPSWAVRSAAKQLTRQLTADRAQRDRAL